MFPCSFDHSPCVTRKMRAHLSSSAPSEKQSVTLLFLILLVSTKRGLSTDLSGEISRTRNLTRADSPYRVTSADLIVAKDVTLNIEAGAEIQFASGVGLKIHGTLIAQGTSTNRITFSKIQRNESVDSGITNDNAPYNKNIRLVGGTSYKSGRLELFVNNEWGTVCNDIWDMRDTQVACRQLGFLGAKRFYTHRGGAGRIWLDDVNCKGTETSLLKCSHRGIGSHNCREYFLASDYETMISSRG